MTATLAEPTVRQHRILELDGLRALAAIAVILYHMSHFTKLLQQGPDWLDSILKFIGPKGVHVFFIISGYIITKLLIAEFQKQGGVNLTAFFVRRVFRIVPPLLAYSCVLLILRSNCLVSFPSRGIIAGLCFVANVPGIGSLGWLFAHTWSLSVEEQFYLLFPPFMLMAGFRHPRLALILMAIFYLFCVCSLSMAKRMMLLGDNWEVVGVAYHFRHIIVGVVTALMGDGVLRMIEGKRVWFPMLIGIADYFMCELLRSGAPALIKDAIEPAILTVFVMWFPCNPSRCRILRLNLVQHLGKISYSVYLWQQLFTAPPNEVAFSAITTSAPAALVAIFVVASGSYYLIEKPSILCGRHLSHLIRIQSRNKIETVEKANRDLQ